MGSNPTPSVTAPSRFARLSAALQDRAPAVYRPLRRCYSLIEYARWNALGRRDGGGEAFGESFWDVHADAAWDWAGFAACLLRYTHPRALVDVGCGDGKLLAAMRARDPSVVVHGYDGSAAARQRAARRGVAVEAADFARLRGPALARLTTACRAFDTALCLEVAEHLLPWHAGRLLAVLAACPTVVFSAAPPGQGGTLHVNERPAAYWIGRFAAIGYGLSPDDAAFRAELAGLALPPWYARNAHLFVRRGAGNGGAYRRDVVVSVPAGLPAPIV